MVRVGSQTGDQRKALFGTAFDAVAAENAAIAFKTPFLIGLAGDGDRVGRAFAGADAAVNALVRIDDQLAPLGGKGFADLGRIHPGRGALDHIAEDILENRKKSHVLPLRTTDTGVD
ncbi:hypothetical protein SDC9_114814 [bioreactor metagenome]|uniref:Uncharacterized protein n=1 Tax=bioreactor metagenome TaxID=1076179 RepID=A0A645BR41_9ZZZZ